MKKKLGPLIIAGVIAMSSVACGKAKTVEEAVSNADTVIQEMNSKNYNGYDYESTYLADEKIYGIHMTTDMCSSSDDNKKLYIFDSTVTGATLPELTDDQSKYIKSIYGSFKNFDDVKVVFVVLYSDDMIKAAVVDGKQVLYASLNDAIAQSEGDDDFPYFADR